MSGPVLIRVDATPSIGSGHLMRMIALGQLLHERGCEVHLLTVTGPAVMPTSSREFAVHRIRQGAGIGSREDADDLVSLARRLGPEWIVLDGYAFGTEYQRTVREAGARLMSVDDLGAGHFVSDVVLNQNYGAERRRYSTEPYTRKYLGTGYLIVRREFRATPPRDASREPPRSILVSLGGGASTAMSALEALVPVLEQVPSAGIRFRLIGGMLAARTDRVFGLAESRPERFDVVPRTESMVAEMAAADIAITSGGTTTWELMCMRVPFLAVSLNAPQGALLSDLHRLGACIHLGPFERLGTSHAHTIHAVVADAERRRSMVSTAASLLDPKRSSEAVLRIFGLS